MEIGRTKDDVYDLKYHLVWIPEHRNLVLGGEASGYLEEVFNQIAGEYRFVVDTMEVVEDHVHIFWETPNYSPAEVEQMMKSICARKVFKKFPKLRKQLWKRELWNNCYFARSVGDKITSDIIRKYIDYQSHKDHPSQLTMFGNP